MNNIYCVEIWTEIWTGRRFLRNYYWDSHKAPFVMELTEEQWEHFRYILSCLGNYLDHADGYGYYTLCRRDNGHPFT